MADYTQVNDYSVKDGLSAGDPAKLITGTDVDADLSAIATAIATKYDATDLASLAEAQAETDNTKLMTALRVANWSDAGAGMVGDIHALADPGFDTILGWDDTGSAVIGFTLGTGITSSGTAITSDDAAIDHDALSNFVADEHIAHAGVTITAGAGLTGGGTIAATRTLDVGAGTGIAVNANDVALSHLGIQSLSDPGADRIMFWDDSAGAMKFLTLADDLTITATTLTVNHDLTTGFVSDEHVAHGGVTLTAGDGLSGGGTIAASRSFAVDSTVIRTTGNQTLGGVKTLSSQPIFSAKGGFLYYDSATQAVGAITVSTSAASGTPGAGDLWFQYTA